MASEDPIMVFVGGTPCSGKSTFCYYLETDHRFTLYDMEGYDRRWKNEDHDLYWFIRGNNIEEFVKRVKHSGRKFVIQWGFTINDIDIVKGIRDAGIQLIWFMGDISRAREAFIERKRKFGGPFDEKTFDAQVEALKGAGLPEILGPKTIIIETYSPKGELLSNKDIFDKIFETSEAGTLRIKLRQNG